MLSTEDGKRSTKTVKQYADMMMTRPRVKMAMSSMILKLGAFTREVLSQRLMEAINGIDIAEYEDLLTGKTTLKELRDSGVDTRFIQSIKVSITPGHDGRPDTTHTTLKMHDWMRALAMLAKIAPTDADLLAAQTKVGPVDPSAPTAVPAAFSKSLPSMADQVGKGLPGFDQFNGQPKDDDEEDDEEEAQETVNAEPEPEANEAEDFLEAPPADGQ
jgi:hypothetical protein